MVISHIVMLLLLTTSDCDTGLTLYSSLQELPMAMPREEANDCRKEGVRQAYRLTARFKGQYPNASTNVVCMIKGPNAV